ncbi:uncharacterized protein [Musca autumnalis]|uniref:uncharacterized protein n=1 Tax=Musca autumnalis TaxID=221902 RepID=UPI003CF70B8C
MSTKASNQPGRRTPLSLSGGVNKGQNSNRGGNSTNGHTNNNKQDNKNQQQKTEQQNNNQKQQHSENAGKGGHNKQQTESKIPKPQTSQNSDNKSQKQQQQQSAVDNKKSQEKQQNGVASNNNKNNQQSKDNKSAGQSSKDIAKTNDEKDNKKNEVPEKAEKVENIEKETKVPEKQEKEEPKPKEDVKDEVKEDKNEENETKKMENLETDKQSSNKVEEQEQTAPVEEKSKDEQKDKVESMDVAEVEDVKQQQEQPKEDSQMSAPPTPKSVKENIKAATPNKTPNKSVEKTPTKSSSSAESTPKKANEKTPIKTTPTIREVTTAIDDVDMEPLTVDHSPLKMQAPNEGLAPSATSTPGKIVLPKRTATAKTDVQLAMQPSSSPERPRAFSQISGRRAIRPITEYTPSKFQSNPQFRESYRRINTELDATNTSLNVTVGSEIPNNSSFSFFMGRGRKRERTPPHHHSQSAIGELQTDMDISPPKRARLDFFSVVSSPLSLLRNRFSKATLQSSTPVKLQQKLEENEDDVEVQNVSGVSVHEDIEEKTEETKENSATTAKEPESGGNVSLGVEAIAADNKTTAPVEGELEIDDNGAKELPLKCETQKIFEDDGGDIKITVTDNVAKNKRCIVM